MFNWATWFGIDDIRGHNPVQIERYVEYIDALNGHRQEYHERNIFPNGLSSPLLDLLNTRFLIVPADAPTRPEYDSLPATMTTVYSDDDVRIVENPEVLPRAWLVHEARQVAAGEALALLADGTVDPLQVALLESTPPPMESAFDANIEAVKITDVGPDRLGLEVTADSAALLMLSEVWDPGWSATVDGTPAPVLLADHVLRAVPIPPGSHTVALRYTPPLLPLGLAITSTTVVVLASAALWSGWRRRKERRSSRDENL